MQFSEMKSTIPFEYCTIAPGDGQALRQPGSEQCMQPSLRISHSSRFCSGSTSKKRISVHELGLRSCGLSYTPTFSPTTSRKPFQFMHATWQALQPMHFDSSISFATSVVWRTLGVGDVVLDRAVMSSDCSDAMARPLCLLDVHDERLEFRRLGVRIADVGRERVREIAVLGHPLEAPMDRHADHVHLLAVDVERAYALRHHRGGLHLTAVRAHLHHLAVPDALLPRQVLADLDERRGLDDGVRARVLRPEVLVLREPVRRRGVRELIRLPECLEVALVDP